MNKPYRKPSSLLAAAGCLGTLLAVSANADYATSLQAQKPVGYWPLNETLQSPALNTVANAGSLGASGTGHFIRSLDGIDAKKGEPGIVGQSVRFYNNGNTVGYSGSKIDVPFTPGLNPNPPFTVEFWAKPNTLGADVFSPLANLNSYFTSANRSGWIFYAGGPGGYWQFRVGGENSYAASPKSANGTATNGAWSHVVGVFDGAAAKLYVNGALAASADALGTAPFKANEWVGLRIGSTALAGSDGVTTWNHPYGNRQFDGWVDEVAIYASALTADQIASHFSAASTNNAGYHAQILADQPLGYWGLDEPAFTNPDPAGYPQAGNAGSAGSEANAVNSYGVLAAAPGVPYSGFPVDNKSAFFTGLNGNMAVGQSSNLLPVLNIQGMVTLSAWIKPTQKDWYREIISHGNWATGPATFLRIGTGDGTVNQAFYEVGQSDGQNADVTAMFPIPQGDIGNWVYLVGTYDGTKWNLYRNGKLVATQEDTVGAVQVSDKNWAIGADSDPNLGATLGFGGWIDEPAVFDKALSASVIQSLYYAANVPPVITAAPQLPSGPIYEGSSVTLSVWAEGNPTIKYQWTKDGTAVSGQTATNLVLNSLTAASSGVYAAIASNDYGSVTSKVSLVVQASKPVITKQPVSLTRWAGQPFALSLSAIGTDPIACQWYLNGTAIPQATRTTYTNKAAAAIGGDYMAVLGNALGSVTSSVATLTVVPVPAGYASAIVADTPIAYYRLDESSGTVAHDFAGGNDGTYHNATLGKAGFSMAETNKAVSFAGTGSYMGDINPAAFAFQGTNNVAFSIEAWVNGPAQQMESATIVAKGTGGSGGSANEQFALDLVSGTWRFFIRNPGGTSSEATATLGPDGNWHHLVGVYDGPSGLISLYVDGELAASISAPATGVRASSFPLNIGSRRSGVDPAYDWTFEGSIDEVAIYNVALTPDQVVAHYSAAYGTTMSPVILVQPQSVTNYIGLPISMRVGAVGSVPLAYQWKKNGANITGANSSSFSIDNLGAGDAGDYTVEISNQSGKTNSAVAKVIALGAPATPPEIPGLVLHLKFDNNLTDATGRGHNGKGVGSISYVADGAVGQGLHYSTDTAGTNYVTLGVVPDLQFSSNVNFSVAFWIRLPANYTGGDLPFFTDTTNSTFGKGFVFAPTYGSDASTSTTTPVNGGWAFSVFDGASAGIGGHGPIGSINDGNWHHLVYVLDRQAGCVTYLDGLISSFTRQQGTIFGDAGDITTGAPAVIGQDPSGAYNEKGSADIDDLGVWRKALTQLEAASIFMAGASNRLSFGYVQPGPVTLGIQAVTGGKATLTWSTGTLQASDNIEGGFADVPSATSPYTVSATSTRKFYRIKQ